MEYSQPLDSGFATELEISSTARGFLLETAKWSRFLAIIGFIFIGFMVIGAFSVGAIFSTLGSEMPGMEEFGGIGALTGPAFTIIYLVFAAFYFFPTLYFYRFATKTKLAVENSSSLDLTEAFGNLKSCIKFWGIFTAVIIGIYALFFAFAILGGLAAAVTG